MSRSAALETLCLKIARTRRGVRGIEIDMVVRRCLVAAGREVARTWSPRELPSAPRCASSGVRHVGAGVETPIVGERQRHHPRGGNHPFLRGFAVPAPRRYASSPSIAGEAAAPGLQAGSLVVVALRDSAKSPRRLAVVKGPAAGPGGYILLEMDAQQEVAVRPQSIKMALPPPSSADGDATGAARCVSRYHRPHCCLHALRAAVRV
jgi:hypothetical protein